VLTDLQGPTVGDLGEHALIARITARLRSPSWVVVRPGDDAAVIHPVRGELEVVTTDALVEGVHFDRRFVPPDAIGHRVLAVNLSDLAAMGASPRAALLSLIVPPTLEVSDVDAMLDGLLALADRYQVAVIGGNITRSTGATVLDVTAIGSVRPRRALTRAGARPGDDVYVTGSIGDGAAGLEQLREGRDVDEQAAERYLRPEPRVRFGKLLARNRAASACIDLSDGLADGVRQIAASSGAGITLRADAIPIASGVRRWHERLGRDPIAAAMSGGDDYELLFTARPSHAGRLRSVRQSMGGLPVAKIGVVTRDPRLVLEAGSESRALAAGFEHFRN
jgi:thiamine-monophosphate kinase